MRNLPTVNFDQAPEKTGDFFARSNPEYLNMFYGTDKITPLWVADMDLPIADSIMKAVQHVAKRGQFAYEFNSKGIFTAIAAWYQRRHNLALDVDNFVPFPGVLTAIALLVRELTDETDGVLIQLPAYHQFSKLVTSARRGLIQSPLKNLNNRYEMDFDDLEEKFRQDHVRAMILCNPHNPVGRVWRKDELQQLVAIANRYDVRIISDEIHADIIYEDHNFNSIVAIDDKHVAVIGSPAKTFGMHSISNGYIYTKDECILNRMKDIEASMHLGHGNAFTTHATIAAYENGDTWLDGLLAYLQGTISAISDYLEKHFPSIKMSPVEGTYQIWFDCSATGLSGDKLKAKLGETGFGATPGTWFDQAADKFIRINIAAPRSEIIDALARFCDGVVSKQET